jgi:hypothetical protein
VWQVSFSFFMIHDQIFSLLEAALQMHCPENLKPIFLEMKLCGLIPNFYTHVSVSDLYIPTISQKTLYIKIGGPSVGIHKWLIDTGYGNWEASWVSHQGFLSFPFTNKLYNRVAGVVPLLPDT